MARTRLFVDIDMAIMRKLILWSKSRGEKRNAWARVVIAQECEKSEPQVRNWFEAEAKRLKVSVEELEDAVLTEEGFDLKEYRADLMGKK